MNRLPTYALIVGLAVALAVCMLQRSQIKAQRAQIETLESERSAQVEVIGNLQSRVATPSPSPSTHSGGPPDGGALELARLRNQLGQFLNDQTVQAALTWKAKEARLKALFEQSPSLQIPEMRYLTDRQWLDAARDADLESKEGLEKAMCNVRSRAKESAIPILQTALRSYVEANGQTMPEDVSALIPFFSPPVDEALLQRYRFDGALRPERPGEIGLIERTVVNDSCEGPARIGMHWVSVGQAQPKIKRLQLPASVSPAMKAYLRDNPTAPLSNFEVLRPYVNGPDAKEALERFLSELSSK